ncbi:hypothetical protein OAC42_01025 [Flavobacteriaceae bacterium]|nr:hypothetical protein [Flavobacteriaceae bacterium]
MYSIINFSSDIFFFLKLSNNLKLGANALYSNKTSEEFEGNSDIETPPSISLFFNMLKLAVLIIII